jgi:hypothetical protein
MIKLKAIILAISILPLSITTNSLCADTSIQYVCSPEFKAVANAYYKVTGQTVLVNNAIEETDFITNMAPLELMQILDVMMQEFMDIWNHPNISLRSFSNTLIFLIDTAGHQVPNDLKDNVKQLINDKKESNGILQLRAGHPLANDILLQVTDIALGYLVSERMTILQYANQSHIDKVAKQLKLYKRKILYKIKKGLHTGLSELSSDIQNIAAKMQTIWDELIKKNPNYYAKLQTRKPAPIYSLIQHVRIFRHRISQNKK